MNIAFDTNDVFRDFYKTFAILYRKGVNRAFNVDDFIADNIEPRILFPFESEREMNDFMYDNYQLELFGHAGMIPNTIPRFNDWLDTIRDYEYENDEEPNVTIISYGSLYKANPSTLFFFAKRACIARLYDFETSIERIWDKYDVIITANNYLLESKPEGKIAIKINTAYNKECPSDYTYDRVNDFFQDNETYKTLTGAKEWH